MGAKGNEISCNRNMVFFDSNVKRGFSTRISFEGITTISNQDSCHLQSLVI
ncbi:hypothetical protein L210DRAFT_3585523, partial [Boletus edulis BED1]